MNTVGKSYDELVEETEEQLRKGFAEDKTDDELMREGITKAATELRIVASSHKVLPKSLSIPIRGREDEIISYVNISFDKESKS